MELAPFFGQPFQGDLFGLADACQFSFDFQAEDRSNLRGCLPAWFSMIWAKFKHYIFRSQSRSTGEMNFRILVWFRCHPAISNGCLYVWVFPDVINWLGKRMIALGTSN